METLIVCSDLLKTVWFLKDANGFVIAYCGTEAEAVKAAKELGYHVRVEK